MGHCVYGSLPDLIVALLEFLLDVDIRSGDEGVDPWFLGFLERFPGPVDISFTCTTQARYLHLFHGPCHGTDCLEISL
jgi:hypothetical protein